MSGKIAETLKSHFTDYGAVVCAYAKNKEAVSQNAFKHLRLGFQTALSSFYQEFMVPQMKSTVALGWIFPYSPKSTVSLICMRNLAICGVLCMACMSSASCAVTCLVCRMVEVGRGVWKILVF